MARVLHEGEWFDEVSSRGHYESEFEQVIGQEAPRLFGGYRLVEFKTPVTSADDRDVRKADFALIREDYGSWWVVEVELAHHSLDCHVVPQVRTLSRATYGSREAHYLCRRDSQLDIRRLLEMFKGDQPRVLVLVNAPVEGWAARLSPLGVRVLVCQLFRSRLNRYLLTLSGELPSDDHTVVTVCECEPLIHRLLRIHSPARLAVPTGETVLLHHNGRVSEWVRTDTATQSYLHARRDHSLKPGRRYEIVRRSDQRLFIRDAAPTRLSGAQP